MTLRLTLALLAGSLVWGQNTPIVFPVVTLTPPGTAALPPVLLTGLPAGFAQQIVTSVSQRCTYDAVQNDTQTPTSDCTVLSGDRRLLIRQGSLLTGSGNSLLTREQDISPGVGESTTVTSGIDLLDESDRLSPTIRNLVNLDSPQLTCEVVASDQASRTERNILSFVYNEPLGTLYVVTVHRKTYYGFPQGSPPSQTSCIDPMDAAGSGIPVVEDSTRTLIRIIGPFEDRGVLSGLPASPPSIGTTGGQ